MSLRFPRNLTPQDKHLFSPFPEAKEPQMAIIRQGISHVTYTGLVFRFGFLDMRSVYPEFRRLVKYYLIGWYNLIFRKTQFFTKGKYTIIHNFYCPGYFHWVTEALCRAYVLGEQAKEYTLILPEYPHGYVRDSLAVFPFKNIEILSYKTNAFVRQLAFASQPTNGYTFDPVIFNGLREKYLLQVKSKDDISSFRKVYVSRSQARARKIANEDEIIEILKTYGFEMHHFDQMPFWDLVRLMSETKYLVSIHGAALANMVFMPAEGTVFELYRTLQSPDEYFARNYSELAYTMGHSYYYQFCPPIQPVQSLDLDDIQVDVSLFSENIQQIVGKDTKAFS